MTLKRETGTYRISLDASGRLRYGGLYISEAEALAILHSDYYDGPGTLVGHRYDRGILYAIFEEEGAV